MKSSIFLLLGFLLYGCNENPIKCYKYYTFKIPIITSILQDTFRIGDTIWFESKFSNKLELEDDSGHLKLENFNFGSTIKIKELIHDTLFLYENPFAETKFEILKETNDVKSEFKVEKIQFINYQYQNEQYYSKIYIIPKQKGFFYIAFGRTLEPNPHGLPKKITNDNNCNQYYQGVKFYLNNGINNSGHLLKGKYRFNTNVTRTEEDIWIAENQAIAFYVN